MALVAEMALLCPSIDSKTQNQHDDNFVDINNCTQTHSPKKIQLYLYISIYHVYNIVKL